MSDINPPENFQTEEYDPTWPVKIPSIEKVSQYLLYGRIVDLQRWSREPRAGVNHRISLNIRMIEHSAQRHESSSSNKTVYHLVFWEGNSGGIFGKERIVPKGFKFDSKLFKSWSVITEDILSRKARRIMVKHDFDDTVLAAFSKRDGSSMWEASRWNSLASMRAVKRNNYQLWIESETSDYPGELWLQNLNTNSVYKIIDRESARHLYEIRQKDHLDRAFEEREGTWKMVNRIYSVSKMPDKVTLWARVSKDNLILDRVVAKRFPGHAEATEDEQHMRDELMIREEIEHHSWFSFNPDAFTVQLRGVSIRGKPDMRPQDRYIAFMEYCEAGDLDRLIIKYRKMKRKIPEPFIWIMFRNLVAACREIESYRKIHTDIKYGGTFRNHKEYPYGDSEQRNSTYSKKLEDLLFECLRINADDRPSLEDISNCVEEALNSLSDKRLKRIKDMLEYEMDETTKVLVEDDPFALNSDVYTAIAQHRRRQAEERN
ncbi:G2-specific serine/threonine protein kinase [Kalmusia sp. IMI 367209]|nr:G2-specific serine/threonine protein kinase [Kalmusia sp. IMI 367209]